MAAWLPGERHLAGCEDVNIPYFDNEAIEAATPYPELIAAIGDAFRHGGVAPARHVHDVPKAGEPDSVLLLMPSWNDTGSFGVKLATINAENASRDLLQAIDEGALTFDDVAGDLYQLAATNGLARRDDEEITVFKSVDSGLEDLAAAVLCKVRAA